MKQDRSYELAIAWAIIETTRDFGLKLYMTREEAIAAKAAGMWDDGVCIAVDTIPMGYRHGAMVN
jgi:hypothetical protein